MHAASPPGTGEGVCDGIDSVPSGEAIAAAGEGTGCGVGVGASGGSGDGVGCVALVGATPVTSPAPGVPPESTDLSPLHEAKNRQEATRAVAANQEVRRSMTFTPSGASSQRWPFMLASK